MNHLSADMRHLLELYTLEVRKLYGTHLRQIVLYGSYARGDYSPDSDIDIMILLNLDDLALKDYDDALSDMTYDFNINHDVDIMPYAKSEAHFRKWSEAYPFYANVHREGVVLYAA